MAKKENNIPTIIDTPEALTAKIAAMKEAQKIFATFTQDQVDKIFKAAATAADKARIPLAKDAVEETGMGIVEDKVIKNLLTNYIVIFSQKCKLVFVNFFTYLAIDK